MFKVQDAIIIIMIGPRTAVKGNKSKSHIFRNENDRLTAADIII